MTFACFEPTANIWDFNIYTEVLIVPRIQKILEEDLDKLQEWSNTWLLKCHPDKCKRMTNGGQTEKTKVTYTSNKGDTIHQLEFFFHRGMSLIQALCILHSPFQHYICFKKIL